MRIPGRKRLTHTGRWLRSRISKRAVILGYHRIADEAWDPLGLSVSPRHFAGHLEAICELARPVSLSELVTGLIGGEIRHRSVVITFDDGYAENLYSARPLLEKHSVPATVFVISGHLAQGFWWDELVRLLDPSANLPDILRFSVGTKRFAWNRHPRTEGSARTELLHALERFVRSLPASEQSAAISVLRNSLPDGHRRIPEMRHRSLTAAELARMIENDLVEIGSHTHSHPQLGRLTVEAQQQEIEASKRALEAALGRTVEHFSYPHGSHTAETRRLVEQGGFRSACSSRKDVVTQRRSDAFSLPRLWVSNMAGPQFRRWLRRWLGA